MAIIKFTPPAVPFDASPELRQWLDSQVRRLSLLVNDAIQPEDVADLEIAESQITDGSILARLDDDETITGAWTFSQGGNAFTDAPVRIVGDASSVWFEETDQAADARIWTWGAGSGVFRLRTFTDAEGVGSDAIAVTRGTTTGISEVELNADLLDFNGDIEASGALTVDGLLTTTDGRITAESGTNLDLLSGLARINVGYFGIGDEATDTVSIPNHGAIVFVLTANTSATELNGYAIMMVAGTTITTLHSGSLVSIGAAGTNPDVNGDSNIWVGSAGTLSIKNRRGSFRRYTIYTFNGGA